MDDIGSHQLRVRRFDLGQLAQETIVLAVGDLRLV